jgi:hypothetical protein
MKLSFIIIIFSIISCNTEKKSPNNVIVESLKKEKYYFDFDQIDHYKTDFDEKKSIELIRNSKNSENDKLKYEVILGDTPKNIQEIEFLKNIEKIGFTKKTIEKVKFKNINNLFMEKHITDDYAISCAPVFRDILVFYKKKQIIGMAKICFSCKQNIIIGTNANTEYFGHNGDYGKLRKILSQ